MTVFHFIIQLVQEGLNLEDEHCQETFIGELLQLLQLFSPPKVKKDVTVNKVDDEMNTPLHYWASLEFQSAQKYASAKPENILEAIFKHLQICGVRLNSRNQKEETPLHRCRTWFAAKQLVAAGAKTHIADERERSPLLVAAQNQMFLRKSDYFYPDVTDESRTFWENAIKMGFDLLAKDKDDDSILGNLLKNEAFILAKGLVEILCEKCAFKQDEALVDVLNTICKDKSTQTVWKNLLVEMILKSRTQPIDLSSCLRFCCTNILDDTHSTTEDKTRSGTKINEMGNSTTTNSVHWQVAKQLLLHGTSGERCLDLAEGCPELQHLLTTPTNIDEIAMVIPWTSHSKTYKKQLAEVARRRNCKNVEGTTYWYQSNHIASGAFSQVFAGINAKDGMEVAVKKIERLRMKRPQDEREIRTFTVLSHCKQIVHYLASVGGSAKEDVLYVILELMEGTLDDYFASTVYNSTNNTQLTKDVALGLTYLHDQDVIHRDLKPSNILYKTHPILCLKLADFGLSRPSNIHLSLTVMSRGAGTRGWIAPEVIKSSTNEHSKSSDIFSCGLIIHYIFSKQQHPFNPALCTGKSELEILTLRETNILSGTLEGWDSSLPAEVSHLVGMMLESNDKKRPTASNLLDHPIFWSSKKKLDLLSAVGNQPEFQCPRSHRHSFTAIENQLDGNLCNIVKFDQWDDIKYTRMFYIFSEMTKPVTKGMKTLPPRTYDTSSVVELVRFIRNSIAHVSDASRTSLAKDHIFNKSVFLEEFPNLLMEVYKSVIKHGWNTREEINHVIGSN